jgi:uncharacterized membrane protein YqgA involved in biofilm formation
VSDLAIRLLLSAVLTLLIKGGVALFQHSIAWWAAALIALVVVFGSFLILGDSDGWWD